MNKKRRVLILNIHIYLYLCLLACCLCQGQMYGQKGKAFVELISRPGSPCHIILPLEPTANENKAAAALQEAVQKSTGVTLSIIKEGTKDKNGPGGSPNVYVGATAAADSNGLLLDKSIESFRIVIQNGDLYFTGGQGHALQYAVYYFAEQYLGGFKPEAQPAAYSSLHSLRLPADLDIYSRPAFNYRESYYPLSQDGSYLNWHALQRFDDLWGLWGHSYFKLLPPAAYFKSHPEYYALVNGQRKPSQLCLSNAGVLQKVIDTLKVMMADNPDALYWSIAPNDGGGYCDCALCRKANQEEGGPQGSLIRFVNKVAAAFPDKKITTLAYQGTAEAPLLTHAAKNVVIMLSSIDVFRETSIPEAHGAASEAFRRQLKDWSRMADQVFIWDYSVQFTNYLSPFPDLLVLSSNLRYFKQNNVQGVFIQGSGTSYCDAAELNSFVQAKLLWNPELDPDSLINVFCKQYYGNGSREVQAYLTARRKALQASGRHLDIYGNPMPDSRGQGYLSRANVLSYKDLLETALKAVPVASVYYQRIQKLLLGIQYVQLQQSLFYGPDSGGFLVNGPATGSRQELEKEPAYLTIKPGWKEKVAAFTHDCKAFGVTELSEDGLTPDEYDKQWQDIFNSKWPRNLAMGAAVTLKNPYVEDYPAKGNQTLTDGMTGFKDFSYNWLCFYGTDLEATLDLGSSPDTLSIQRAGKISVRFLDDPRHWIFPPSEVKLFVSQDGIHFKEITTVKMTPEKEHMDAKILPVSIVLDKTLLSGTGLRYIRLWAECPATLPNWRSNLSKKPMIAADEIMVSL